MLTRLLDAVAAGLHSVASREPGVEAEKVEDPDDRKHPCPGFLPNGCVSPTAEKCNTALPPRLCAACRSAVEGEYQQLAEDTRHGNRLETETVSRLLAMYAAIAAASVVLLNLKVPAPLVVPLPGIGVFYTLFLGLNHFVFIKRTCDFEVRLAYLDDVLGRVHYNLQPYNLERRDVVERPRSWVWLGFYGTSCTALVAAVLSAFVPDILRAILLAVILGWASLLVVLAVAWGFVSTRKMAEVKFDRAFGRLDPLSETPRPLAAGNETTPIDRSRPGEGARSPRDLSGQ
jgi:hypothetical protein